MEQLRRPLRCSRDFNRLIQPYIASTRDVSLPALLTRHCIVLEEDSRWDSQALKARVRACLVVDLVAQPANQVPVSSHEQIGPQGNGPGIHPSRHSLGIIMHRISLRQPPVGRPTEMQ